MIKDIFDPLYLLNLPGVYFLWLGDPQSLFLALQLDAFYREMNSKIRFVSL